MRQRITIRRWERNILRSSYEVFKDDPTTRDGVAREYDRQGQLGFEGVYRDGRLWEVLGSFDGRGNARDGGNLAGGEGVLKHYNDNHDLEHEGTYKDGLAHGTRRYFFSNGAVREHGEFQNGERVGLWTWLNQDGTVRYQGEYRDGARVGEWKLPERQNWFKHGEYRDGVKTGEWQTLREDGSLYRREVFGEDGARSHTYYDGRLVTEQEGLLIDDKFMGHGEEKKFDESGAVSKRAFYDLGTEIEREHVDLSVLPAVRALDDPFLAPVLAQALGPNEELPQGLSQLADLRARYEYTTEQRDELVTRVLRAGRNGETLMSRITSADPAAVIILADEHLAWLRGERPEALAIQRFHCNYLRHLEDHPGSIWLAVELVAADAANFWGVIRVLGDRALPAICYYFARQQVEKQEHYLGWLATHTPEIAREALLVALNDRAKKVREIAIDGLTRLGEPALPDLWPMLDGPANQVSMVATILRDVPSRASIPHLEQALAKQRSAPRKELIQSAINACKLMAEPEVASAQDARQDTGDEASTAAPTELYAELDAGLAARTAGKVPAFETRPALCWKDGTPVSEEATSWIVATLAAEGPERPNSELVALRAHLDDESCQAFGQALVDELGWDRWVIYAAGILGGELLMDRLGAALQELVHEVSAHHAAHGVTVLARSSTPAVRWLDHWAGKAKTAKLKKDARKALAEFMEREGLTKDDLLDQTTPTFDFSTVGEREFDYAGRSLALVLDGENQVLIRDEDGKVSTTLPRARKDQDAASVKAARARFKAFKKAVTATAKDVLGRLEAAMVTDRRWPRARWQAFFLKNPVLYALSRGLVYAAHDESGAITNLFFVTEEGTLAGADLNTVELPPETTVSIPHPVVMSDEQRQAWAALLTEAEVVQPFPQLHRPFTRNALELLALDNAITLPAKALARSLYGMGYTPSYFMMDHDRVIKQAIRPLGSFELILHHTGHYYKTAGIEDTDTLQLERLVARAAPTRTGPSSRPVPASIYSEAVQDLQAFLALQG